MLCFRKLLVAIKIMDKRGTVGYQDFPSKVFCTTMPKNFRKGTLLCCLSENFRYRKSLCIGGGAIKIFRRKFLVPQGRKIWQGNPFVLCFRTLLVANKIMDKRGTGGYQDVPSKVFCTTMPKNFRKGTLLCCVPEKFRLRKRLWIRKGDIKIFRRKDFCLRVPKVS